METPHLVVIIVILLIACILLNHISTTEHFITQPMKTPIRKGWGHSLWGHHSKTFYDYPAHEQFPYPYQTHCDQVAIKHCHQNPHPSCYQRQYLKCASGY